MTPAMHWLILGFGYSAAAFAQELRGDCASITVTSRTEAKVARWRAQGWDALVFDGQRSHPALDAALGRATHILVSVPPDEGFDPVLAVLEPALRQAPDLRRLLYLSTIGVYGDHQGGWVDEETPPRPLAGRSQRRLQAEQGWRDFAARRGVDLGIFRLSGIYGPGRSAIDQIRAGTARRILKPGQVFNRIHVADIAGALIAATRRAGPLDLFNLTDHEPAPPQDVVEYAAQLLGVPPPPAIAFEAAGLSGMALSFYAENKRVSNACLRAALGYRFRYPTYREGLRACL